MLTYEELLAQNQSLEEHRRSLEALLRAEQDRARDERDKREAAEEARTVAVRQLEELRKSYAILQQEHELLRRRIFEAKAERADVTQLELEFAKTKADLDAIQKKLEQAAASAGEPAAPSPPPERTKTKPTGRRSFDPSSLPVEHVEISDPEMEQLVARGAAEVVGADKSMSLKHRRSSMVLLVVAKKTYRTTKCEAETATTLVTATAPASIIERSIGTPSLYANIAVEKFDRAMPLYRQEERFTQIGVPLDRGMMSRWMDELGSKLAATIIPAMRADAFASALCLATDATGILVQQGRDPTKARRPCRKGHYFVQIADRDAVFFEYTPRETSAAVLEMFRGFTGYVQADAKSVYDILFREPDVPPEDGVGERRELGCWSHMRRYFWEAAAVAKEPVAREALFRIRRIFEMDAKWDGEPPSKRKTLRDQFMRREIESFFAFVETEWLRVKDQRGLLRSALGYATNQKDGVLCAIEAARRTRSTNRWTRGPTQRSAAR